MACLAAMLMSTMKRDESCTNIVGDSVGRASWLVDEPFSGVTSFHSCRSSFRISRSRASAGEARGLRDIRLLCNRCSFSEKLVEVLFGQLERPAVEEYRETTWKRS